MSDKVVMKLTFGKTKFLNGKIAIFYEVPWSPTLVALVFPEVAGEQHIYLRVDEISDLMVLALLEREGEPVDVTVEDVTEKGILWFEKYIDVAK